MKNSKSLQKKFIKKSVLSIIIYAFISIVFFYIISQFLYIRPLIDKTNKSLNFLQSIFISNIEKYSNDLKFYSSIVFDSKDISYLQSIIFSDNNLRSVFYTTESNNINIISKNKKTRIYRKFHQERWYQNNVLSKRDISLSDMFYDPNINKITLKLTKRIEKYKYIGIELELDKFKDVLLFTRDIYKNYGFNFIIRNNSKKKEIKVFALNQISNMRNLSEKKILIDNEEYLASMFKKNNILFTIALNKSKVMVKYKLFFVIYIICSIILLFIEIFITNYRTKKLFQPLYKLSNHMINVSKGDFSIFTETDEFIGYELFNLVESFNYLIRTIKQAVSEMNHLSNSLLEVSSDNQIILDSLSKYTISTIETIKLIDKRVNNTLISVNKLANSSMDAKIKLAQSSTNAMNGKKHVKNINTVIQDITNQSDTIMKSLNLINDIIEETNLLSLNTSIEASKAGKNGKGFQVIANHIRELSEQSANSADYIVKQLKYSKTRISSAVKYSKNSDETFNKIIDSVKDSSSFVDEFADAMQLEKEKMEMISQEFSYISNSSLELNKIVNQIKSISDIIMETSIAVNKLHQKTLGKKR